MAVGKKKKGYLEGSNMDMGMELVYTCGSGPLRCMAVTSLNLLSTFSFIYYRLIYVLHILVYELIYKK